MDVKAKPATFSMSGVPASLDASLFGDDEPTSVPFVETSKGGPGSGNFGHAGRPGKVGGSAAESGGISLRVGSLEFERWFSGSKVVDWKGKPLIMYHGTNAGEIESFDIEKTDPFALYGSGFYFTDDPGIASDYSSARSPSDHFKLSRKLTEEDLSKVEKHLLEKIGNRPVDENLVLISDLYNAKEISQEEFARKWDEINDISSLLSDVTFYGIPQDKRGKNPTEDRIHRLEKFMKGEPDNLYNKLLDGSIPDLKRTYIGPKGRVVYSVYLSIKNPFDIDARLGEEGARKLQVTFDSGNIDYYARDVIFGANDTGGEAFTKLSRYMQFHGNTKIGINNEANEVLRKAGYDGITHIGGQISGGRKHRVYIAWNPTQIKSATSNETYDPNSAIMTKGGRGSGNFGHSGRPGKVGGSAGERGISPVMGRIGDEYSSLISGDTFYEIAVAGAKSVAQMGFGYIILNDGTLVGSKSGTEHEYIATELALYDAKRAGISPEIEAIVKRNNANGDFGVYRGVINKVVESGAAQVRLSGNEVYINTQRIDTKTMRKIQEYFYAKKLGKPAKIMWASAEEVGYIECGMNEFLASDGIARLAGRRVTIKGGPGSGNFAHRGRPGRVGGSGTGGGKVSPGSATDEIRAQIAKFSYRDGHLRAVKGLRPAPISDEQLGFINRTLDKLPPELVDSVKSLVICQTKEDFGYCYRATYAQVPDWEELDGIGGFYDKRTNQIFMPAYRLSLDQGGDLILAHEYAHRLYLSATPTLQRNWANAWDENKADIKKFSEYAASDVEEGFCEVFSSFAMRSGMEEFRVPRKMQKEWYGKCAKPIREIILSAQKRGYLTKPEKRVGFWSGEGPTNPEHE